MSSPSKPVDITSPRQPAPIDLAGSSSPSARVLRAQYAGTPPPPNIPARATPTGTPNVGGNSSLLRPVAGEISSSVRRTSIGGITASWPLAGTSESGPTGSNPLDDLSEEDKVRVLRRHLVSREERQRTTPEEQQHAPGDSSVFSDVGTLSKRSSASQIRLQGEDADPFPVPYHAPGADVT